MKGVSGELSKVHVLGSLVDLYLPYEVRVKILRNKTGGSICPFIHRWEMTLKPKVIRIGFTIEGMGNGR